MLSCCVHFKVTPLCNTVFGIEHIFVPCLKEIEFVLNIDENMTNIVLNGEIIAILENTQIIDITDLDFIEYQSIKEI